MMYDFTKFWFLDSKLYWQQIFDEFQPKNALEIGSFEGQSAVFMIENGIEHLDCVDIWDCDEIVDFDFFRDDGVYIQSRTKIFERFKYNTDLAQKDLEYPVNLEYHRMSSKKYFRNVVDDYDLIYIDGSHKSNDVLRDAVLSFDCLRSGGIIIFDDYDWVSPNDTNIEHTPKIAIDAWISVMKPFITEYETNNKKQKYFTKNK